VKPLLSDEEIHCRAKLGLALNLKHLAVATGYGYSTVRSWRDMGMPLLDGKITVKDALSWRKEHEATQRESRPLTRTVLHHPLLAAGRCDEPR
jgi:hypothetical protein